RITRAGCQSSAGPNRPRLLPLTWTAGPGGSMPWKRIGWAIAAVVLLFALMRIGSVVVDWAWFSSIGYVGVFWTAFVTKAALFMVGFVVSTVLLWANGTLALWFASRSRLRVPAGFSPSFMTFQSSQGPWAQSSGLQPSPMAWRLMILAV